MLVHKIQSCIGVDELRAIWKDLSPEQREAHGAIFTEAKERLS